MSKSIKAQKTRVIQSSKDSSHSEQSAYWDDAQKRGWNSEGNPREHPCANPDVLPETEIASPSTPQLIFGEAVDHLQGRQREVYLLTMREGKSWADTAEILGITKGSAQQYRKRAIKFIESWCQAAMKKGRV